MSGGVEVDNPHKKNGAADTKESKVILLQHLNNITWVKIVNHG
jgi:hypothetical protein